MLLLNIFILITTWYLYGWIAALCFIGLWVVMSLVYDFCCYIRATNDRPTHQKHGMCYDYKKQMLVGTTTDVYTDYKTGRQYLGKTTFTTRKQ